MSEHTPGPWKCIKRFETDTHTPRIFAANGHSIAEVQIYPDCDADATFIVTACNCHEKLLEACKSVVAVLRCHLDKLSGEATWEALAKAETAINKVEGRFPPQWEKGREHAESQI